MANQDNIAPSVLNKNLEIIKVTDRSISIQWEKAKDDKTPAKDIRYVVGLTEADNADDPWHIVAEAKDICEYTFPNLKPDTLYAFTVKAKDKEGNVTQYPVCDGSMTAKTLADQDDRVAPTVYCRHLDVAEITNQTISIKWQKATDNETRAKDIRYVVGLTEALNDNDPWHIVREGKDICAHTFKNLKSGTTYAFYVMAFDESGNYTQYPVHNGSLQATTEYGDNQAPLAPNREIVVKDVTENTISIQWERVKDDMTKSKDIRYVIGLTETDNDQDPWHIVGEDTNICQFTFSKLCEKIFCFFKFTEQIFKRCTPSGGNNVLQRIDYVCKASCFPGCQIGVNSNFTKIFLCFFNCFFPINFAFFICPLFLILFKSVSTPTQLFSIFS